MDDESTLYRYIYICSHTEVFFDFGPYFNRRCLHSWLKFAKKHACDKKQRLSRKVNINIKSK